MKMRCIMMPIQPLCQNCVLGLQWNMKIKSKVENYKKKHTQQQPTNQPTNQPNKQTINKKCLTN